VNALPSSIETYLEEAGFSQTEILILKRLLDEDALTLREFAAKTGKSTGVLDQAMKKLLQKGIINKEYINDGYKFSLLSLDAVSKWMQNDMRQKRESLARRHQNFESFLATLKVDKHRPDMEYYDGEEGMEKAYRKLLEQSNELLHYMPVVCSIEDDPLRDFKVEFFRERRSKGIFSRVIAHNTPLGRRFQTRDPFEYRQTMLVDEEKYPFTFEKIIAGDTIACFNLSEKRACFIRYPELAAMERAFFERLWTETKTGKAPEAAPAPAKPLNPTEELVKKLDIPLTTKTLSSIREFFLSRKSVATFALLAVLSAAVTFGFYKYTADLQLQRIQDQAKSIAATGAIQVKGWNFDEFKKPEDIQKTEYQKLAGLLNEIRKQNEGVAYVYMMRPTGEKGHYEFIADADTIDFSKKDYNKDGLVNALDVPAFPGQPYDGTKTYREDELVVTSGYPSVEDAWGSVVTGWSPVKDETGKTVAIFGVDVFTRRVQDLTLASFKPLLYFLIFFLVFVAIRLAAFNRSLFQELVEAFRLKRFLVSVGICAVLAGLVTYGIYAYTAHLNMERVREQVKSIAATGALQFSESDLNQLHTRADIVKPEYAKVIGTLNKIRNQNPAVKYIYILRPSEKLTDFTFIADADSLDPDIKKDYNGDGVIGGDADQGVPPGKVYDVSSMDALASHSYNEPTANSKPYTDQWGTFMTGYAPIKDSQNKVVALLGIDIYAKHIQELTSKDMTPFGYFFLFFFLFVLIRLAVFNRVFFKEVFALWQWKKTFVTLGVCAFFALIITYSLYSYTKYLNLQQMRESVKSAASAAALQFDPNDLNALQVEEDWKKPEWAKVVNQLKAIRLNNKDLKFAYIIRKVASDPTKMIFVADSHSLNPYANTDSDPTNDIDANGDGRLDPEGEDKLSPPNDPYPSVPSEAFIGYEKPFANYNFYEDGWGKVISGYAPIRDQNGNAVAVMVVDIRASKLDEITANTFYPIAAFFVFFILLVAVRLISLNPKVFKEIYVFLNLQKVLLSLLSLSIVAFIITYGLYQYNLQMMRDEVGKRLLAIATTAAPTFDPIDLNQLRRAEDLKTIIYQRNFKKLNEIKNNNPDITYAYILRPTNNKMLYEWVVDADSNFDIPSYTDANMDGIAQPEEQNVFPGGIYDVRNMKVLFTGQALREPAIEKGFNTDQWGTFISAYAPIKKNGNSIAILGLDMHVNKFYDNLFKKFIVWEWFFVILIILISVKIFLPLWKFKEN
jgi:predicted transcriptional regulator